MNYIPNMDFVNYLSTLGGLMSMYAGLSVNSILTSLINIVKIRTYFLEKCLSKISCFNFKIFSPSQLIRLIFVYLMIKQIHQLIDMFFNENPKTDVILTNDIIMPNFRMFAEYYPDRPMLGYFENPHRKKLSNIDARKLLQIYHLNERKIDIWLELNEQNRIKCLDPEIEISDIFDEGNAAIDFIFSADVN